MASSVDQLREAILQRRPLLRKLLEEHGTTTVYDYITAYLRTNIHAPEPTRQQEFITTFQAIVSARLGMKVAQAVSWQLEKYYFVSTGEHQAPLCASFALNSDMLMAMMTKTQNDPVLQYSIVLGCSSVSLNHRDFPRGVLYHAVDHNGNVQGKRASFFPSRLQSSPVYNLQPFTAADLQHAHDMPQTLMNVYAQADVLASTTYAEQITKTNNVLWQNYFAHSAVTLPDLIYIEEETVVSELLLQHHLYADTTIHHILFDPTYEAKVLQPLQAVFGGNVRQGNTGTDLFWGILPDKHHRIKLTKKNNELVSEDGTVCIPFTPSGIADALQRHSIFPNLLLVYIVLSLYYQLNCLGGFNQMQYLSGMQALYNQLQIDPLPSLAYTIQLHYGLRLLFTESAGYLPVLGPDLALYSHGDVLQEVQDKAKCITMQEAVQLALPDYYLFTYSAAEADPQLQAITLSDIVRYTGVHNKLAYMHL